MASNLRVDNILPSNGTHVAIGTAGGTISLVGGLSVGITSGANKILLDESEDDNAVFNIPFSDHPGIGGNGYQGLQVDNGALMFNPGANRLSAPSFSSLSGNHLFLQAGETTRMILDVNGPIAIATATSLTAAGNIGAGYSGQTISSRGGNVAAWVGGTQRVLEIVASPCDGSKINSSRGDVTFPNITAPQDLTTSYADVTGSTISYCPPVGTKQVIYELAMQVVNHDDGISIGHFKFFIDSDEVVYQRKNASAEDIDHFIIFRYIINIGGSANTNTGRVASWTTHKTLKMQAREYHAENNAISLHETDHWDGATGNMFSQPSLTITAIGC